MSTNRSACNSLVGALALAAGLAAPLSAAGDVEEMTTAELRALFHSPDFSVPDGLSDYSENYRESAPAVQDKTDALAATAAESSVDRVALCTTLKDALDYLRRRAMVSRVSFEPHSHIVRWYNTTCTTVNQATAQPTGNNRVDAETLARVRRHVARNPEPYMTDY